jgi:transposase-like protein
VVDQTLFNWVKKNRQGKLTGVDSKPVSAEQMEIARLNPVEYLWAWLKRHALANFCPKTLAELKTTARDKLRSGQRRRSIIAACWKQADLW